MKYDISKMLRNKESAAEVSPDEFFASDELGRYLYNTAQLMTDRWTAPLGVAVLDQGEQGIIAYTDNTNVVINAANPLVKMMGGMLGKFKCLLGIFYHELAHVLYLDFKGEGECIEGIRDGRLPFLPDDSDPTVIEVKKALENPYWRQFFAKLYLELANYASDNHDEDKLMEAYSQYGSENRASLVEQGIMRARACNQALSITVEQMLKASEGKISLKLMMRLIFQYIRFGRVISLTDDILTHEAIQALQEHKCDADIASATDSTREKFMALNRIVFRLWPLIKQQIQDNQNQQSQSQSGQGQQSQGQSGQGQQSQSQCGQGQQSQSQSGQGQQSQGQSGQGQQPQSQGWQDQCSITQPSLDQLLDAIAEASKDVGESSVPQMRENSKLAGANLKQSKKQQSQETNNQEGGRQQSKVSAQRPDVKDSFNDDSDTSCPAFDHLMKQVKEQKAADEVTEMIKSDTLAIVKTVNAASPHSSVPLQIRYMSPPPTMAELTDCNTIHVDVGPTSRRLQQKLKEELKALELGGRSRRLSLGPTFNVPDAYRPDGRFFTKKKLPENIPEMVAIVLVDQSASMKGSRINSARTAAILLDDFCRRLGIPVMVAGHNTAGSKCIFTVFADFDRSSENAKYKLAGLNHVEGCNRDGMAVEIISGLLAKRPEPVKLLFIISDGQPHHTNYGGELAAKDIQSILKIKPAFRVTKEKNH